MKRPLSSQEPPHISEIKACIEKRLFVGRLQPSVNEEEFRQVFGAFGNVTEVRLIAEKGVGFVTYDSWASAHRALVSTDNQPCLPSCGSVPISVSFAERTGIARGTAAHLAKGLDISRVFVGGLPEALTDPELKVTFEVIGKVEGANLLPAKGNRRCGFVNFSLWGEAMDAIEMLDGTQYPGTNGEGMSIVLASPPGEKVGVKRARHNEFEFAPPGFEDMGLETLKAAYITAVDSDAAPALCDELHHKIMAARSVLRRRSAFSGTSMQVSKPFGGGSSIRQAPDGPSAWGASSDAGDHASFGDDRDSARLFVGGLPYECADEELRGLVEQLEFSMPPAQRQLLECRVLTGRGCGYIRFSTWEAASEALQALNDREVSGWPMPLRVTWATPKGGSGGGGGGGIGGGAGLRQASLAQPQGFRAAPRLDATPSMLTSDAGLLAGLGKGLGGSPQEAQLVAQGLDPTRLFVGQLTRGLTDKGQLHRVFEPFGRVEHLKYLEDKGVAYVQYSDFASASAAQAALSGKFVPGVSRREGLNVDFSQQKRA